MQELRLVAVSEDGTYAVLAVPGRGGRFSLPIDDRLRTVARGQFSRLAQYEIEVENPLRPKEIQDRIRSGETAEEIADAAGIPIERVRRFEGPVLAEREYRAQEAQRSTVRGYTDSGPGPRLGDIALERLAEVGAPSDTLAWDSRKRADGNWQVQLQFMLDGRPQLAEWVFDPRRRHVIPADDLARRLCLPQGDWPSGRLGGLSAATATVTPIGSRLSHHGDTRADLDRLAARAAHASQPATAAPAGSPGAQAGSHVRQPQVAGRPVAAGQAHEPGQPAERPAETARAETARAEAARADAARAETARAVETARAADAARASDIERAADTERAAEAARTREAGQGAPGAGREPAPGRHSAAAVPAASAQGVRPGQAAGLEAEPASPAGAAQAADGQDAGGDNGESASVPEPEAPRPARKAAGGKARRASVPSWDEIMLGNSRQPD
jgi:hypothetical protein